MSGNIWSTPERILNIPFILHNILGDRLRDLNNAGYSHFLTGRSVGSGELEPAHKKPGMKKFSHHVPETFDFCFCTLGP